MSLILSNIFLNLFFKNLFILLLFKFFFLSTFDYCSSLFVHFSSQVDQLRLERSYSNAVFALLRVNLYDRNFSKQNSTMMSLEWQLKTLTFLKTFKTILIFYPLNLDILTRFLFMNITKNPKSSLVKSLINLWFI